MRRGTVGIEMLLIFIALVLIAAMAMGVTIRTASLLQSKALRAGTETMRTMTKSITVSYAYGLSHNLNLDRGRNITEVALRVQLEAGADPIRFSDIQLVVPIGSGFRTYTFYDTFNSQAWPLAKAATESELKPTGASDTAAKYLVAYIINSVNGSDVPDDDYLEPGEVVELRFALDNETAMVEGEVRTVVISIAGGRTILVDLKVPDAITQNPVPLM